MRHATAFAVTTGLVALAAVAACVGSDATAGGTASANGVDASSGGDAAGTTPSAVVDDKDGADCTLDVPGNLMTNGSFSGGTGGWGYTSEATVDAAAADAGPGADCRGTYGIVRVDTAYSGAAYDITAPIDDAGTDAMVTLDFGVSVLPLGGNYDQIDAKLAEFDDTGFEKTVSAVGLQPGEWRAIQGTLAVRAGGSTTLRVTSATPRTFGIDRAWITVHRP